MGQITHSSPLPQSDNQPSLNLVGPHLETLDSYVQWPTVCSYHLILNKFKTKLLISTPNPLHLHAAFPISANGSFILPDAQARNLAIILAFSLIACLFLQQILLALPSNMPRIPPFLITTTLVYTALVPSVKQHHTPFCTQVFLVLFLSLQTPGRRHLFQVVIA